MLINDLKFGADPEYFAYNPKLGVVSPALLEKFSGVERLGGDDKHPEFIHTDKYIWMGDGVAHELTLKKPYENMMEMHDTITESLSHLKDHLSKVKFNNYNLYLRAKPVTKILPELYLPYLDEERIKMGFIYGCDADEDAIESDYKCGTRDASRDLFRYAGGHLHFSSKEYSELFRKFPKIAVKLLAVSIGSYVIWKSKYPGLEKRRIGVYGRPGRFRKQKDIRMVVLE